MKMLSLALLTIFGLLQIPSTLACDGEEASARNCAHPRVAKNGKKTTRQPASSNDSLIGEANGLPVVRSTMSDGSICYSTGVNSAVINCVPGAAPAKAAAAQAASSESTPRQ